MVFFTNNLEEEIYVDKSIDFILKRHEDKVCHIKRSIYGFNQSFRS